MQMGLDSHWVNENRESVSIPGDFKVCGGLLSGHGNESFRGKVYDSVVQAASGVSLYQEYIDPATVRLIADKLAMFSFEAAKSKSTYDITPEEYADLQRMFKIHAETGHALMGDW